MKTNICIENRINELENHLDALQVFSGNEVEEEMTKSKLQDLYDIQIQKLAA